MLKKPSIVASLLGTVALLCSVAGCQPTIENPKVSKDLAKTDKVENGKSSEGSETKDGKLAKTPGPKNTGDVVFAIKDGKAMVLLDLQPEAGSLVKLAPAERDIHLRKRAFANLEHKIMAKTPYKDKDRCVVRMVMLTSIDQYNRPEWGSAVEIANFEIDLAKVRQTGKSASVLKLENVAEFFVSQTVNQENIKEYPVARIKTN